MNLNASIMRLIGRLGKRDNNKPEEKSLIHPAFRLCTILVTIILCSLSNNAIFTYTIIAYVLVRCALLQQSSLKHVFSEVLPAVLLALLITLPSVFLGSPGTMLTITMKVFESVSLLALLNEDVSWQEMTASLRNLHVPGFFILILDTTIRFLVILGNYSNAMLEAVTLRAVGKESWKDSQIGGILGTTFLKSKEMSEMTSEAMACRCFQGTYQIYEPRKVTKKDYAYLSLIIVLFVYFLYTESVL